MDRSRFHKQNLKRVTLGTFLWNYFKIRPPVPEEEIFKVLLKKIIFFAQATRLFDGIKYCEQFLKRTSQGTLLPSLVQIGPAAWEKKMFKEIVDDARRTRQDRQQTQDHLNSSPWAGCARWAKKWNRLKYYINQTENKVSIVHTRFFSVRYFLGKHDLISTLSLTSAKQTFWSRFWILDKSKAWRAWNASLSIQEHWNASANILL